MSAASPPAKELLAPIIYGDDQAPRALLVSCTRDQFPYSVINRTTIPRESIPWTVVKRNYQEDSRAEIE